MAKQRRHKAGVGGWSDMVLPNMEKPFGFTCCDCGLVHDLAFDVYKIVRREADGTMTAKGGPLPPKVYQVAFKARRNERSTGQVRRHMKGK